VGPVPVVFRSFYDRTPAFRERDVWIRKDGKGCRFADLSFSPAWRSSRSWP
jgi:hypothetical protein